MFCCTAVMYKPRMRINVRKPIYNYYNLLPAATKLGQGNVFTGVCDSVHRRGCLPQCMLGCWTPPWTRHPPTRHPPGSRPPSPGSRPPRADPPPPGPGPPPDQAQHPPSPLPPVRKQTPAYGQWAAGTHPTGMHSCYSCDLIWHEHQSSWRSKNGFRFPQANEDFYRQEFFSFNINT